MDAPGDVGAEAAPPVEAAVEASAPEAAVRDVALDAAPRICFEDGECADRDPCTMRERCDPTTHSCVVAPLDSDGDGYLPAVCGGADCNDITPSVHPGQLPSCGTGATLDLNCNGTPDRMEPLADRNQRCVQETSAMLVALRRDAGLMRPSMPATCAPTPSGMGEHCKVCWFTDGRLRTECACWIGQGQSGGSYICPI